MQDFTTKIINMVYGSLGITKQDDTFYADIASDKIDRILEVQRASKTHVNNIYEKAGFDANSITARIVQNQIARG